MKNERLLFALLAFACLITSRAFAWESDHCDVQSPDEFLPALEAYQLDDEASRLCKTDIRFMNPMTVVLDEPLMITAAPPEGQDFGTGIRRCTTDGQFGEAGCAVTSDLDVTIDARRISGNDGRCPIRVYQGAKIDLIGLRLLVNHSDAAICTGLGVPIPLEDTANRFAYIHDVTIIGEHDAPPPLECSLTPYTWGDSANRYYVSWNTQGADRVELYQGSRRIAPAGTGDGSLSANGSQVVEPIYTSTYTLKAHQGEQECTASVTIPGRVRPLNRRFPTPFGIRR